MVSKYTPVLSLVAALFLSGCCPYGPHRLGVSSTQGADASVNATRYALSASACENRLEELGVGFRRYRGDRAQGVRRPIILEGNVRGLAVRGRWDSEVHSVTDCRLVLAVADWAPILRRAGVREIQYFSMLRPGARIARSGRVSSHASAMAIDVGWFILDDGTELSILDDWEDRDRGDAPCGGRYREDADSALMRRVVCDAAREGIFQVMITPHHDHAHRNHLHLEVRPDARSVWLR